MKRLPSHIEDWSDERSIGNGIIVTLARGWSFYSEEHSGVRGFDLVREARENTRKSAIYPCHCDFCQGKADAA